MTIDYNHINYYSSFLPAIQPHNINCPPPANTQITTPNPVVTVTKPNQQLLQPTPLKPPAFLPKSTKFCVSLTTNQTFTHCTSQIPLQNSIYSANLQQPHTTSKYNHKSTMPKHFTNPTMSTSIPSATWCK